MKTSINDKHELASFCKQYYKNNTTELKTVEEFEQDYTSNKSLWWYTRQSFVYRLLNKALRIQNIDILFLFRFFIRDINRELEKHRCSSPVCVYRAQLMSKDEIQMLKDTVGEFISINSFFSTSLNRDLAIFYLTDSSFSNNLERVFFQITADPQINNTKPFSNLSSLSHFPNEDEVLFMIGTIFRINQIVYNNDGIWNVQLMLYSDNDNQLQLLFKHMRNELGNGKINLLTLGHVLHQMGKLDDAEKCVCSLLTRLSDDHPDIGNVYHVLGMVTNSKGDYESSLKWYNKAFEVWSRTLESYHPTIASIHISIGNVYQEKDDFVQALEAYERALIIFMKAFGEDHLDVATCFNNISIIHQKNEKYSEALGYHQKVLSIRQKQLRVDHPLLGDSHNNIGSIYTCLGDYDQALEHLNLSVKIYKKSRPSQHPDIAMTLENIGVVYEAKDELQQALPYFEKAAKIYHHTLPSTHPDIGQIDQHIQGVLSKLNSLLPITEGQHKTITSETLSDV
jgi:tetratricopeptide (TPR) repeat protein